MEILTCKKYNEKQTAKWNENYNKVLEDVRLGKRHLSELPQLAFYIFNKDYGYVINEKNSARWFKTKQECIKYKEQCKQN